MVGCENVSVRTDNHARAQTLQRLFTLPLGKPAPEKLAKCIVGKRKCRRPTGHGLTRKHCNNARRDLFHDGGERRNNSFARLLHLRRSRKSAGIRTQNRSNEQDARRKKSFSHKRLFQKGIGRSTAGGPFSGSM